MEMDPKLVFSCGEFAERMAHKTPKYIFDRDNTILDKVNDPMSAPHPSPAELALFAEAAYVEMENNENHISYQNKLKLPSGWELLTTARNEGSFNGYFGAAYWSPLLQQVVLAHRGTVPSNLGAMRTNIMGVVFKNYSPQISSAATFVDKIRSAINEANEQEGKQFQLSITGHSLGGWLAQLTGLSVKHMEVKEGKFQSLTDRRAGLHAHVVAFDSPGCKKMFGEIIDSYWCRHEKKVSVESLDVSSYFSAPNQINTFGLHVGNIYRVMVDVSKFSWFDRKTPIYTIATHKIENFTNAFAEEKTIHEMKDWPVSKIREISYLLELLPKKVRTAKTEYKKFHQKVSHAKEYDLDLTECDENSMEIRYKKKNCDNSTSLRIFSEEELKLLNFWNIFKREKVNTNKIQNFLTEHNLGESRDLFENFSIDIDVRTITCDSKESLEKVIKRTKLLMRWFSADLMAAVEEQSKQIPKIIYSTANQTYLNSLPDCTYDFIDCIGLQVFLQSDDQILRIKSEDCDLEMLRLFSIARQLRKLSSRLDTYVEQGCHTFLRWADVQHLEESVDIKNPLDNFTNDNLLVINCASTDVPRDLETDNHKKIIIVSNYGDSGIKPFTSNQLTENSKRKLFKKKMFGIADKIFSIADIIGKVNFNNFSLEINTLISTTDLKEILRNNEYLIEIKNSCPNLIDFYGNISVIDRKVSVESLTMIESSGDPLVVSGSPPGEVRDKLARAVWVTGKGNAGEEKFKQIISENPNNKVYWLEANDSPTYVTIKQIHHTNFYMKRRFHQQIVFKLKDFAAWSQVGDKFIFRSVPETMRGKYLENKNILTAASDEEVDDILKKNYKNSVHLLEFDVKGEQFLWKSSRGSLKRLRKYGNCDADQVTDEGELHALKRKAIIIADDPGMGKSTSLANMARRLQSDPANWVIWMQLKHFRIPNSGDMPQEPRKRCEFLLANNLAGDSFPLELLQFCVHCEHSKRIYFMFDGFDEIKQAHSSKTDIKNEVLKLFMYLNNKTSAIIWVTTRLHETKLLENALTAFAVKFEKIGVHQQQEFLCNFWRTHLLLESGSCGDAKLKQCAQHLHTKAKKDLGGDIQRFMGVPLQMRMLAEVFLEQVNGCVTSENEYGNTFVVDDVYSLYSKFIASKINMYCSVKTRLVDEMNDSLLNKNIAMFTEAHRNLSVHMLFPEFAEEYCESSDAELDVADLCRIGLIQAGGGGCSNVEFIHRTLTEYFVADQINRFLRKKVRWSGWTSLVKLLLTDVLLQDSYKVIRMFLNNFLLRQPIPDATREPVAKEIGKLWNEIPHLLFNNNHQTALHEAFEETNEAIVDLLFGSLKLTTVHEGLIGFVVACDKNNKTVLSPASYYYDKSGINTKNQEIWKKIEECSSTLPREINLELINASFITNDVKYVGSGIQKFVRKDIPHINEALLRIYKVVKNIIPTLFAAVEKGDSRDIEVLYGNLKNNSERDNVLLVKNGNEDSILHIAALNNQIDTIKILCNRSIPMIERSFNGEGDTPLHCAAEVGHLDIVKHLVNHSVRIDCLNLNGQTALHTAAENGHLSLVEYLVGKAEIKRKTYVNSADHDGCTALHGAAENGDLRIVKCLIGNGGDIDCVSKNGITPLHAAIDTEDFTMVRYLVEQGADVNYSGVHGCNALQLAKLNENSEIEKYLEENMGICTSANKDNNTELHVVAFDTPKIKKYLHEITFKKDESGPTQLHIAAGEGNLSAVEYLVKNGGDINLGRNVGDTALHRAARKGHLSVLQCIVEKGGDINLADNKGWTALQYAALQGHLPVLQYVVEKGGDINLAGNNGWTALHYAARAGHLQELKFLVEKGGDVNSADNNDRTALHLAAWEGHLPVLKYLLEKGADENSSDNNGGTALHHAAWAGHLPVLKYLVERESDINSRDNNGCTALHLTAGAGHLPLLQYLVKRGWDINAADKNGLTALHHAAETGHLPELRYLVEKGGDINCAGKNGQTALHHAAGKGHLPIIQYMGEKGVDMNSANNKGNTALHHAASAGHLPVLEFLLEKGGDINSADNNGWTAVHHAACEDHLPVLQYIVEKGGDINSTDNNGKTALHHAAKEGHLLVLQYLVEMGKDINSVSKNGQTALHHAVLEGHFPILQYLIEHGGDINSADNDGSTAVHHAAKAGHLPVLQYLVKKGGDINSASKKGSTALHRAARNGHLPILQYLIDNGGDINSTDYNGWTALHHAARAGHLPVLKYIVEKGGDINSASKNGRTALQIAVSKNHPSVVEYLGSL